MQGKLGRERPHSKTPPSTREQPHPTAGPRPATAAAAAAAFLPQHGPVLHADLPVEQGPQPARPPAAQQSEARPRSRGWARGRLHGRGLRVVDRVQIEGLLLMQKRGRDREAVRRRIAVVLRLRISCFVRTIFAHKTF